MTLCCCRYFVSTKWPKIWTNQDSFASSSSFSSSSPSAHHPEGHYKDAPLTASRPIDLCDSSQSVVAFFLPSSGHPACLSQPLAPSFGGLISHSVGLLCAMLPLPPKRCPIPLQKQKRRHRMRRREHQRVCHESHRQLGRALAELRNR